MSTSPSTTTETPSSVHHHHTHSQFWTLPGYGPDYGLDPFYDPSDPFLSDPFLTDPYLSDPFLSDPFLGDPFFYEAQLGWYRSSHHGLTALAEENRYVAEFQRSGSVVDVLLTSQIRKNQVKKRNQRRKKGKRLKNKKQKRSVAKYGVGSMDWKSVQQWRDNWGQKTMEDKGKTKKKGNKKPKKKWKNKKKGKSKKKIRKQNKKKSRSKKETNLQKKKPLRRSGSVKIMPLKNSKKTPTLAIHNFLQAVVEKYGTFDKITTIKPTTKALKTKIKNRLFHKIRRFSNKNIEEMVKTSRKELKLPYLKTRKPRSVDVKWQRLRKVLMKGLRGPSVSQ